MIATTGAELRKENTARKRSTPENAVKSTSSSSQWNFKGLLKISSTDSPQRKTTTSDPTQLRSASGSVHSSATNTSTTSSVDSLSQDLGKCYCCGTVLTFPSKAKKFRCSVCQTTNLFDIPSLSQDNNTPHLISYDYIKKLVDRCYTHASSESGQSQTLHQIFEPLSSYLYHSFKSNEVVSKSFKIKKSSKKPHYHTSNINYPDIHNTFNLLAKLPTKRPLFSALKGCSEQLRRISIYKDSNDPRNYCWVLIFLEIPILRRSLLEDAGSNKLMSDVAEIKMLSYDILKRCLGILSCIDGVSCNNYIKHWFTNMDDGQFIKYVDLINLYITFQLKKYLYLANNPNMKLGAKTDSSGGVHDAEYLQSLNLKSHHEIDDPVEASLHDTNLFSSSSKSKKKKGANESKARVHQYGNDWHIKSALVVMYMLYRANDSRSVPIHVSSFYNSLVDFVNIKLDYDSWQSSRSKIAKESKSTTTHPDVSTVIGYIHGTSIKKSLFDDALYYFCQYPFLISLGGKISVLEYEARRQMGRKAEEAFINSLDKRTTIDIYFKVRIRRERIVQDSLDCIKLNSDNLKKSLKVQFINEPGVDAGGLRKEWFLLLTRAIFHPQTGMLYNVEDSNYLWFNIVPINNFEMYYLFGAVLGLAIYNSTILDLQFPISLYKILMGKSLDQQDYKIIFPVCYKNLMSLKSMTEEELSQLDLTFEVCFSDSFGFKNFTRELIPNGSKIQVTGDNLNEYIEKYIQFFINDGIKQQVESFCSGFTHVIGGNALSLFSPQEIELLLCGSDDSGGIDVELLKSVAKYTGWKSIEEARNSQIVAWFWEYMKELTNKQKRKLLGFVTGSDRVPATGIQNLIFKITLLKNYDCDRLPVAHTCFNELAIYNYSSREKFLDKLNKAISESAGFGIK
ncbi:putative E3 ubiquitin-protein ligase HUL4 [Spathaspora sp. JA1]|nr:putative E3 ubiquitin-protein ligase HUL4 [Spathaspora sp. JA1]